MLILDFGVSDRSIMAAPADVAAPVSAQVVGNAFVEQYYHILHQSPGLVYKFYHEDGKLGRPEEDGTLSLTTTMDEINAKILSLNYEDFKAKIKTVDAQESSEGGVNVLVTGHLTGKDNFAHDFTQSFFLAPQDKGYFVLNDMFRYMDKPKHTESTPTEDVVLDPVPNPEQEVPPVSEVDNNTPDQSADVAKEPQPEKIEENGEVQVQVPVADVEEKVEEEEPVAEVVDEVPNSSSKVVAVEVVNTKTEEPIKKSYASIKQNGGPFSSPPPVLRKPQPRVVHEQQMNNAPATALVPEPASNVDSAENGVHEEEGEGFSVYIKGLPMSATPAILEEEFKKFGPINANGIQVGSNRTPEQPMEIDEANNPGKSFSVPGFLRKVFTEEVSHNNGLKYKLLAIAVRAVLRESGFVEIDPLSKTIQTTNNFNIQPNLRLASFHFTLPALLASRPTEIVKIEFQTLGTFCNVYGYINSGPVHFVQLNESKLVPFLNVVTENNRVLTIELKREVFEFWRKTKDAIALPVLIDLCERTGLELPPCFIQLPSDIKLEILELVSGADVASLSCVCRELRSLGSSDELWKDKYVAEFGGVGGEVGVFKEKFRKAWEGSQRRRVGRLTLRLRNAKATAGL